MAQIRLGHGCVQEEAQHWVSSLDHKLIGTSLFNLIKLYNLEFRDFAYFRDEILKYVDLILQGFVDL